MPKLGKHEWSERPFVTKFGVLDILPNLILICSYDEYVHSTTIVVDKQEKHLLIGKKLIPRADQTKIDPGSRTKKPNGVDIVAK